MISMKTFYLAATFGLLALSSASCADHKFAGTKKERIKEQRAHFANEKKASRKKSSRGISERKTHSYSQSKDRQNIDQRFAKRKYLTGDWGGARQRAVEKGITLSGVYTTDIQKNVAGGRERAYAQAGSFGFDINFDMERLANVPGLQVHAGFVARSGKRLSDKIGNEFSVGQVFGSETYLLNVLYMELTSSNQRFKFKVGRLDGGNDFFQSDLFYNYVGNSICGNPAAIFYNTTFSAYPNSTWGAYMEYLGGHAFKQKLAIYYSNANRTANKYHGADFRFNQPGGALLITESTIFLNANPNSSGYKGNIKGGVYWATSRIPKYTGGMAYNYGGYIQAEQMVWRQGGKGSDRGLSAFAHTTIAPADGNKFSYLLVTGLSHKGLFACRPKDIASVGFTRANYSSVLREYPASTSGLNVPGIYGDTPQHFEAILEVNYQIQVWPWLTVMPDYQYIIHPGGTSELQNAHVLGGQINVTF